MAALRRLTAAASAVVAGAALLTGCVRTEPDRSGPPPEVGWLVAAPPCRASADQIRTQADELVRTGLRDVGFRTVFVDCDGGERKRYTGDAQLTRDLAARGLDVAFPDRTERSAAIDVERGSTAQVRTAVTERVIRAEPLVASADLAAVSPPTLAALSTREVVDFVRDSRNAPGAPVLDAPDIFSRAIGEKGLLISLVNRTSVARDMSVQVTDLNLAGDDLVPARNVWTGQRIKASDGALTIRVPADDTALLRIG
ncbi:hypothetical protein [Gordonia phthalatica]|uniref:Alpha galactosidase C-terminal domain-containing protein n=1 Tax=Gordonia phthalatica TaxID=1136941 RepID=A0A0N9NIX0_9ACTN|nr:hypothetical protein [Gordonia phthalatica]ALG85520.1 hypothetical protein ACH46_14880 [Gordonia phthalatica]